MAQMPHFTNFGRKNMKIGYDFKTVGKEESIFVGNILMKIVSLLFKESGIAK